MKVSEFKELVIATFNEFEEAGEFYFGGLRYEVKERQVGETCEYSRNNLDREDERDFPDFGTEEYDEMDEMDEMDGTSAWSKETAIKELESYPQDWEVSRILDGKHAYLIASDELGWEQNNGVIDHGELVIKDAQVIKVLA